MIVINTADLFGKRNLVSFKMAFGSLKWNWGRNARGWITYDENGKVFVEIRADKSTFPRISDLIFSNILSYSGNYKIQDNLVIHSIEDSSKKSWIGTDLIREIEVLNEKTLILRGRGKVFSVILS